MNFGIVTPETFYFHSADVKYLPDVKAAEVKTAFPYKFIPFGHLCRIFIVKKLLNPRSTVVIHKFFHIYIVMQIKQVNYAAVMVAVLMRQNPQVNIFSNLTQNAVQLVRLTVIAAVNYDCLSAACFDDITHHLICSRIG